MKKRITAAVLAGIMTITVTAVPTFADAGDIKISLGADLSDEQKSTVLSLLELTESDLEQYDVLYVTNDEEHEYLGDYIDSDKIGDTALSSSKIIIREEGSGISVTTYNINYCTTGMYQNALITAGVEDADIYVAGPSAISGTAALIGVMKAYNDATDGALNDENIEAATEELAITSELAESLLYSEDAEQIIAELKTMLDEMSGMSDDEIDAKIKEVAESYGESLSDEDVAKIRELLKNLSGLDLDELLTKARSLYETFTSVSEKAEEVSGVLNNISSFFSGIFDKISQWFSRLF